MEPVTVTITDESAYESYLETLTHMRLAEISRGAGDLADHIPSSINLVGASREELGPFAENVKALYDQLVASGITKYLPKDHPGHRWVEEFEARKQ